MIHVVRIEMESCMEIETIFGRDCLAHLIELENELPIWRENWREADMAAIISSILKCLETKHVRDTDLSPSLFCRGHFLGV